MSCLHYLAKQGLTISIKKDRLIVEPKNLLNDLLRTYITTHKDTIKSQLLAVTQRVRKLSQVTDLTDQQYHWLNQIANILEVTPEYLLKHELIDQFDLVELLDKDPVIMANTIKTGYYWITLSDY